VAAEFQGHAPESFREGLFLRHHAGCGVSVTSRSPESPITAFALGLVFAAVSAVLWHWAVAGGMPITGGAVGKALVLTPMASILLLSVGTYTVLRPRVDTFFCAYGIMQRSKGILTGTAYSTATLVQFDQTKLATGLRFTISLQAHDGTMFTFKRLFSNRWPVDTDEKLIAILRAIPTKFEES